MGREIESRIIAAFDFDGTLTTEDSLMAFIKYSKPTLKLLLNGLAFLPYFTLYKLGIMPNYKAKEKLFEIFFTGMHINTFNDLCQKFSKDLDKILNPEAIKKLKWHQELGHVVLIISASIENYLKFWAVEHQITLVLATKLEVKDDKLTGRFLSKNCYGAEKLSRFKAMFPDREHYKLYAYGDSDGDKELLTFADYPFYRKF